MDQKKTGSFLKELRKQKGITQEELAARLNVSSRSVSRWETGSNMPDISLLPGIADLYGVEIGEIIRGERKNGTEGTSGNAADALADYANTEKTTLFRWVRVTGLIGMVLLTGAIIFQCLTYKPGLFSLAAVLFSFLGLAALAVVSLYADGILSRLAGSKAVSAAVKIAVIVLIALCVRFLAAASLFAGIAVLERVQPYADLSGREAYDRAALLEQYGSDLDSGLFLFPDGTDGASAAEYASSLQTGLFDTDGSILLTVTYEPDAFLRETERLSQISCTVFESNRDNSAWHTEAVRYDTDSYRFPAYVASDGYDSVYEYALIDEAEQRIIYVLLSGPVRTDGAERTVPGEYLKTDPYAYDPGRGSSLDRFSIYSYCFSEGVWSEYSPGDEERVPSGEQR